MQLRTDARQAVAEVREALYDLRTDVSETAGLVPVLGEFLERVGTRSDLKVAFHHEAAARLPVLQEREVLRIAQEAVTNVERHASASALDVTWRVERAEALLQVSDNGDGFRVGRNGRLDSYGLVGMRERAAAIGATLEISSEPTRGTTIRCRIRRPELETNQ
jgi:signal transduction histidine kinase